MLNTPNKIALAVLLATAPASVYAQSAQTDNVEKMEQPAEMPETKSMKQDASSTDKRSVDPVSKTAEGTPVDGQIIMQTDDTVLVKNLIGATVFDTKGEAVGDINDLIIKLDGKVEGVVVGVGGFLGMGEKDIAVQMAKLSLSKSPETGTRLILSSTKEELEAAPVFKTTYDQSVEKFLDETQANEPAASMTN